MNFANVKILSESKDHNRKQNVENKVSVTVPDLLLDHQEAGPKPDSPEPVAASGGTFPYTEIFGPEGFLSTFSNFNLRDTDPDHHHQQQQGMFGTSSAGSASDGKSPMKELKLSPHNNDVRINRQRHIRLKVNEIRKRKQRALKTTADICAAGGELLPHEVALSFDHILDRASKCLDKSKTSHQQEASPTKHPQ